MPQQITIEAYGFSELSEKAKEKARDGWRAGGLDYEWRDASYQDFLQIAKILGIEINSRNQTCRSTNGKDWVDTSPCIYFSGFSSQGDGASFEGSYSYAKMVHKKIRKYAPKDEELHYIADALFEVQKVNGYLLTADSKHSGHYSHSGCMQVRVLKDGDYTDDEAEQEVTRLMRRFADWMYEMLEKEYDYITSDEQVDDTISANEYLFTSDGDRSVVL